MKPDTFVWRDGLPEWIPFQNVEELQPGVTAPALAFSITHPTVDSHVIERKSVIAPDKCSSCLQDFPTNLMTMAPDKWICMQCRPVWEQKLREAVDWRNDNRNNLGGFSARAYGYIIEMLIWNFVLGGMILIIRIGFEAALTETLISSVGAIAVTFLLKVLVDMRMVAKNGGTMGHRMRSLRVIDKDGNKVSYGTAFIRSAVNTACVLFPPIFVSVLIDAERRAPVDFLLGTRVIYNRK